MEGGDGEKAHGKTFLGAMKSGIVAAEADPGVTADMIRT